MCLLLFQWNNEGVFQGVHWRTLQSNSRESTKKEENQRGSLLHTWPSSNQIISIASELIWYLIATASVYIQCTGFHSGSDSVIENLQNMRLLRGVSQCRVLKGARWSVWYECVATYSGRLEVARSFIRQWQQQLSSGKLLLYLGYSVPLPWCT